MTFRRMSSLAVAAAMAWLLAVPAARAADDAPFWTGNPNATQFAKKGQDRIDAAKASIAKMMTVKGAHTAENTLTLYDEALRQLDAAGSQAGLMENVHPDSLVRTAAEKLSQDVSAYSTDLSLDRQGVRRAPFDPHHEGRRRDAATTCSTSCATSSSPAWTRTTRPAPRSSRSATIS